MKTSIFDTGVNRENDFAPNTDSTVAPPSTADNGSSVDPALTEPGEYAPDPTVVEPPVASTENGDGSGDEDTDEALKTDDDLDTSEDESDADDNEYLEDKDEDEDVEDASEESLRRICHQAEVLSNFRATIKTEGITPAVALYGIESGIYTSLSSTNEHLNEWMQFSRSFSNENASSKNVYMIENELLDKIKSKLGSLRDKLLNRTTKDVNASEKETDDAENKLNRIQNSSVNEAATTNVDAKTIVAYVAAAAAVMAVGNFLLRSPWVAKTIGETATKLKSIAWPGKAKAALFKQGKKANIKLMKFKRWMLGGKEKIAAGKQGWHNKLFGVVWKSIAAVLKTIRAFIGKIWGWVKAGLASVVGMFGKAKGAVNKNIQTVSTTGSNGVLSVGISMTRTMKWIVFTAISICAGCTAAITGILINGKGNSAGSTESFSVI